MELMKFKIFGDGVKHGISTRHGGVSVAPFESLNLAIDDSEDKWSNVTENYRRFCEEVGVDFERLVVPIQRHTDNILVVSEGHGIDHPIDQVDGFMTNVVGLPLLVRMADCQPVLMYDPVARVVAAVHSGWRGSVQNIIGKAVRKMGAEFGCDASNILVGIGPSIGECCCEFTDPYTELPQEFHKYVAPALGLFTMTPGWFVDFWKCSLDQLAEAGVKRENIELSGVCTSCNTDKYFSFRAEKPATGRMGAVICLA